MPADRIRSELFVGRERELAEFRRLLTPETPITILNIHTNGDGGIGKTQLLQRMQEHCASVSENVVFTRELIDFYHVESRSRLGVMRQIVEDLGSDNFPTFETIARQYQRTRDASERQQLLRKVEDAFKKDYATFSGQLKGKKVIVLFFDTYECVQGTETTVSEEKQADIPKFSRWIETQLFPYLIENTRIIVSGRYPLQDVDRSRLNLAEFTLARFSPYDTKAFWKACFDLATDSELVKKIGSETLIEIFHDLADGRPVLLALFADWIDYERNPLSPRGLLEKIEERTGKITQPVTQEQKQVFEKALIERVASLTAPEDRAVTYMAVAYRRMTPEMFHFLMEIPEETCREILLERLRPLSFIKYKKGDVVLLHDEMRRLVIQNWWNEQDANRGIRRNIVKDLVCYYDQKLLAVEDLSEESRELYMSELLEYALLADPEDGIARFCNEFDIALENGRYDYCDLLLREAETYRQENPRDIPFPDVLEVELRRIHYINDVEGNFRRALERANTIVEQHQETLDWENSVIRGHFLLSKGTGEYFSGKYKEAVNSFREARQVFYEFGEDVFTYQVNNWIGLVFYGQGNFVEAKRWWMKSMEGFSRLLERREIAEREYRQLIQGIRYAFSNLSFIYNYTGQFDISVRHAEIALNIVEYLPRNTREIARMRILASEMFAFAGLAIDARHHAYVAENLLDQSQIRDRVWEARLKTNLCLLQYRNNEFAYLLEYYRAEEIEDIIEQLGFIRQKDIEKAKTLVDEAIGMLSAKPISKRHLSNAYYALGELFMVTPSADHWEKSEDAFLNSLKWGRESQFLYRIVDTLESLVALYYFWSGASGISKKVKARNQREMRKYQKELEQYASTLYPNLFGKYEVTLGDIEFDKVLELLRSKKGKKKNVAINTLKEAFAHYVSAAELMKIFNKNRFYLTLRVFYNRLNTLIDAIQEPKISLHVLKQLDELRSLWEGKSEEFEGIYTYIYLRIQPEKKLQDIESLQNHLHHILREGDFGLASLLNDCLIGAYQALIASGKGNDEYREYLIRRLNAQSGLYRTLGDEYQAERCITDARKVLQSFGDPHLKQGLEGCINASEGALRYRRGEYGRLLEFYLQGELGSARRRFDRQFSGERDQALKLLRHGEEQLEPTLAFWEAQLANVNDDEEKVWLEYLIQRHLQSLGEVKFRIGELLMLNEQFDDEGEQKGALSYLAEAINDAKRSGDGYRCDNAMESYINALYFSERYNHPDHREKRIAYEKRLEEKLTSLEATIYTSIMSRLRIVQGDAIFSSVFQRHGDQISGYKYAPLKGTIDIRSLRKMLRYYVEACNFMAQHSVTNFAATVRFLQRRVDLIADRAALQAIQDGLSDVWTDQEYLREKTGELETLVQFAQIRSMMLGNEKNV